MTSIAETVEVLSSPEILSYDQKEYRVIRLANQMKVLLVHDKTVYNRKVRADGIWPRNEPACGIVIDVGSLSDPPDIPGLTQFTMREFFGSNEKIAELPWECCLAKTDRSLFIFNLQMDSLDEILAQFSALLKTAPSAECDASYFLEHTTERCYEWRYLVSRLRAQTANVGHPARHYVDDDIISKDKTDASTIRRQMTELVNRHYSAHRMHLCLKTNVPLDEMQDLAVKHFSSVPSNMLPGIDFSPFTHENAYQPMFHENVYFIKAPDAIPQITLTWCVPPETPASQCKPYHYVTEEEFQNAVRDERIDNKMKMCGSPIKYTKKVLRSIVRIGYVAPHETLQLLNSVEFADFQLFCQQFFTQMKIHALIQGNVTVDEAKSIMRTVETNLGCKKVDEVVEMRMIGRTLPTGSHRLSIKSSNGEQKNTARLTYYQIGPNTLRQKVLMDLLKHIISSFSRGVDETRSLQHEWRNSNLADNILGGILTILSEENESRDAFMTDFCEKFAKFVISDIKHMSAEIFQERLTYCLEERDGSRDDLETEIERNWREILNGEYLFDRMQQEREILSTICHSDIVQFVTDVFDSATQRLSIEIIGYNETCEVSNDGLVYAENYSKGSEIRIENIDEFKAILDRQAK